mmetsp:Transcript_37699/g.43058  ORF Transcript_37699/g.43058 Transcript_37699/m.43058 type:complete len:190 (-) Transcript_37699:101-670(-)
MGDLDRAQLLEDTKSNSANVSEDAFCSRKYCEILEQHLQKNESTKNYSLKSYRSFTFKFKDLEIIISIRNEGKEVDISCVVYSIDKVLEMKQNQQRLKSYSLMTKMMKYKAIFHQSKRRQQLRIWNGKCLYIQSFPLSLLWSRSSINICSEIDDFCSMASKISCEFLELNNKWNDTKDRKTLRRSKSYF